MGALERFERQGDQIKDAYSVLQDQIFKLIITALKEGDYQHVDQHDVVLWQAQQLQKIGQLNQATMQLMASVDGLSQQAIQDFVKFNGLDVADEVDNEVQQLAPELTALPPQSSIGDLMAGIAAQTWTDLQNNVNESLVTHNYGQSAVTRTYRQILTESTVATVSGLATHQDAVERAVYKAVDRGLPTRLIDKGGHNWSIEGYTNMVINTTTHRTYNEIRLRRMKDFHMGQALMSSHPNSRPACAYIQGHVVNIVPPESDDFDDRYDSIYNHGYGTPAGTQGINCKHRLFPFVPGVSVNHQPHYEPEEAIKNGRLVQQQRARERAIRDAKHRLAAAKELGDVSMENSAKTLIRARQSKLREFIRSTNAGKQVPILSRDYSREKIVNTILKYRGAERELIPKKNINNAFSVNRGFVNTERFHKQFSKLPLRKAARESLYKQSIQILNHRDGTYYEDIVAIDARTGKVIAKNDTYDIKFKSGFSISDSKLLDNYPGHIILLHNHPGSTRPSATDLISLHKHNAVASAVIGHDGSIRLVKDDYRLAEIDSIYHKWYNFYRNQLNETKQMAESNAMDRIYEKVIIYGSPQRKGQRS